MDPTEHAALERLLAADEEELLDELGAVLAPTGTGFSPPTKGERLLAAREWLRDQTDQLRAKVCAHPDVRTYLESKSAENRINVVASIADVVAGLGLGVPVFVVAVLLFREGLESVCEEFGTT